MEPLVEGVGQTLGEQLRAVHQLTVALHRAKTAAHFYEEAIDTILAVLRVDRASLLLFDPDGVMRFKAWRGLSEGYRQVVEGHTPWVAGQRDAVPILVPDVEADPELSGLLPVLRGEGIAAAAFVPLVSRDGVIGKFMLYYPRPYAFPADEVAVAEILASHVAVAVERQRAHEQLRVAAARAASLAKVTAELSRAVRVADVAAVVLGMALAELGADNGSLCMIDGDELHIAAAVGYPPRVLQRWGRFSLGADLPASEAVRTGRAVFLGGVADRCARYPVLTAGPLIIGNEAYAIVPLGAEIPLGALVIGFARPRTFSGEDQAFLMSLGGQCAAALARAELYEERERAQLAAEQARQAAEQARHAAEQSRARLAFLAEAAAALGSSLHYPATLARLAALAVPRLGEVCAIYLLEDTRVHLVGLAHADSAREVLLRRLIAAYPARLADPVGVGAVLRTGVRQVYPQVNDDLLAAAARDAEHLEQLRALRLGAALIVPLRARGRTIGALGLGAPAAEAFDEETVALAEQLAERAGVAIDNARLFSARTAAARTLQSSLLPPELPVIAGLDLGARYLAGSAGVDVGGDFYDVFPLYGNRYLLVLGDVCGRGVEAACTALLIRHVLHSAAVQLRTPAVILGHLNDVLLRHQPPDADPRFATAVLAVVHPRSDRTVALTLAVAGHPLPLLRDPDGTTRCVGVPGSALGINEQTAFTDHPLTLHPGQALICYTDGVTERRHNGDLFGEAGLATAAAAASEDADAIAATIANAVAGFAADEPSDDLAVLVLRPADSAHTAGPAEAAG